MKHSIYELVVTDDSLPFDVSLHSVNYVPSHWHNSVEIIFVLRGALEATVGPRKYALKEGDVLLINQCHVHEVIGLDHNIIATFLIPVAYLREHINQLDGIQFDCYSGSVGSDKKKALDHIRHLLAEMVQLRYKKGEAFKLEMEHRMLGVFSTLLKQFRGATASGAIQEKYMERMLRIITYIEEHYNEPVSLQDIAEREYLSVPYLSKFFSEHIGMNFQSYLTNIRLKNAVEDLLRRDDIPIAEMAITHGFPNAKSFYTAFKNRYHMTPHEYRTHYRPELGQQAPAESSNYLDYNQSSALGIINQYLQRSQSVTEEPIQRLETRCLTVDTEVEGTHLRHTWRNLITIGKAQEGLHADVQAQIRYLQQHCPFEYMRFHGIFDDGMMVYREDGEGRPHFNFRFVDQLFDFMLSAGLKPFVELGFMPSALAADPDKRVFYRASYVSPPKSTDRWCELVDRFLRHCMSRYGAAEVESWKFEFWNEPEFKTFWPASETEYMELYIRTYEAVKAVSPRLQLGAPGRIITLRSTDFLERFFAFCREHGCDPDFIPVHFYPHEGMEEIMELENMDQQDRLEPFKKLLKEFQGISHNADYLREMLIRERGLLDELGMSDREMYLTEWNSTTYHRELTNDTLYKAAYIVKNIAENLDRISSFGYWVLSDNIEETAASASLFHGGLGLLAQYGIPKAAMYGYEMLNKLGDRLLAQGDGYLVTEQNGSYQILTYNYCHFDDLYGLGDTSFVDETNRYNVFKDEKTLKITLELSGMPSGKYKKVTHTVSRGHGSSFDTWVEMGAPASLTAEDVAFIKAKSQPLRQVQELELSGSSLIHVSTLEPHAVQCVQLIPMH